MDAYLASLQERMDQLEDTALRVDVRTKETRTGIEKSDVDMGDELRFLGEEVLRLHDQMTKTMGRVTRVVEQFTSVVKKKELERLQKRIDVWGPEKNINREMFDRFLEK